MQPRFKLHPALLVALIASLLLGACGGGETGKTWFNLPSIAVNVQPDGTAKVAGFNAGAVLPPPLIQQLQAAQVEKLEARIGYNGVHVYADGTDLPYLSWDANAVNTLQDLLRQMPNIPNKDLIANLLPWLRTFGVGVAINLPGAENAPRWRGETAVQAEQTEPTIGPFTLGGVAFDETGALHIGNIPGSQLGLAGPLLDPNTLGMLQSLGLNNLRVTTGPNGINLSMNDRPLPGIAYDSARLSAVQPIIGALAPDVAPMLETVLPTIQSTQIDAAVSFNGPTGEPAALELGAVPVKLNTDGTLNAFGVAVPGVTLPADLMQKLQAAGVQTLNVDVGQEGLFLAANGQTLPTITWTPETLATLGTVVAPLAGMSPETITSLLNLINQSGGLQANIAVGEGEPTAAEINRTLTTPSGEGAPVMRLNATVQDGVIESVEGLGNLADLGIGPVALPPNVMQILQGMNAQQVQIDTNPGTVNLLVDGNTALTINWDETSLATVMQLATPFLAGTPLEDPNVARLVQEQILPLLPGSDVDVTLNLN
jgi:antitoxin component of MazEF toxin-antitoxin module